MNANSAHPPTSQASDPLLTIAPKGVAPANVMPLDTSDPESESPEASEGAPTESSLDIPTLVNLLLGELQAELQLPTSVTSESQKALAQRIALEVDRICRKSDRIQNSGQVSSWQIALARHRLQKCLTYYRLGSRKGRVELHGNLSAMVYHHVAPRRAGQAEANLGFQGRYNLIEDFLQGFYVESLKSFRKENQLPEDYTPRTQLQLAEYMAFVEQYAKRRITLPGARNQQLIVLRAQGFAKRQPPETTLDIEMAVESPRREEAERHSRSAAMQQVREQMVMETQDPTESVLRDRVITELVKYLETQGQSDCVDYLVLKLQDLSAPEIDQILNLSARQRDYLQQRFKYHVEKFSRSHDWKLVHEWLGADLDQNLGLSSQQWSNFYNQLSEEQRHLLQLKRTAANDQEISKALQWTPKQVQKRWYQLLDLAWQVRNRNLETGNS